MYPPPQYQLSSLTTVHQVLCSYVSKFMHLPPRSFLTERQPFGSSSFFLPSASISNRHLPSDSLKNTKTAPSSSLLSFHLSGYFPPSQQQKGKRETAGRSASPYTKNKPALSFLLQQNGNHFSSIPPFLHSTANYISIQERFQPHQIHLHVLYDLNSSTAAPAKLKTTVPYA